MYSFVNLLRDHYVWSSELKTISEETGHIQDGMAIGTYFDLPFAFLFVQ